MCLTARPVGLLRDRWLGFFGKSLDTISGYCHSDNTGRFDQPGCKRLNLHLKQTSAQTTSGDLKDFDVSYGINLCRNGDAHAKQSTMKQNKTAR